METYLPMLCRHPNRNEALICTMNEFHILFLMLKFFKNLKGQIELSRKPERGTRKFVHSLAIHKSTIHKCKLPFLLPLPNKADK